MRDLIKATVAMLVAGAAVLLAADASFARGGGGGGGRGGGGGGRGGGGVRGGGGAGPRGGGMGPGKGKGKTKAAGGMGGKKASDYVEQLQREDAEAGLSDFLFEARYGSLVRSGEDDRGAALDAEREKASTDRRDASESGAHPL
ncbi:MAG: hypothetical protein K8T90_17130 [Planctomycetes bacterium]|nr:hypothetical protein [Planctomycetota bacterium]